MGKTMKNLLCLKQLDQWGLNFDGMVLGWSPFRIISVGPVGPSKMAAISGHSFNIGPYGKNNEKSSLSETTWPIGTKL